MNHGKFQLLERARITHEGALVRAVEAGLNSTPRRLADPLFFEPRGVNFFSALADCPGFYPTEIEPSLLDQVMENLVQSCGSPKAMVALEAGSALTPERLLRALGSEGVGVPFYPVDESRQRLVAMGEALHATDPDLHVTAIEGDLREGVRFLKLEAPQGKGVLWMGGAINRHDPSVSEHLMRYVGAGLRAEEFLLMGVDLRDDVGLLATMCGHATLAQQHLALIPYLNDELGLQLDPSLFRFQVTVGQEEKRIALQIVSDGEQDWGLPKIPSLVGEPLDTGYFYVYERSIFEDVVAKAGLSIEDAWLEASGGYGIFLLRRAGGER